MDGNSRRRRKNSKKTEFKTRSALKRSKNVLTISDLNDDCLLQILNELSMDDLLNIAQTSSRFKELAKFGFPKLWFYPGDVRKIYEMYSDFEANAIVQNIRKLYIRTYPDLDEKLLQLIKKISNNCTTLKKLVCRDRFCEFVDRDVIIKLCQNVTNLHIRNDCVEDSFMKEILLKNNGQLKVLSIQFCSIYGASTFLGDLKNLKKISFEYPMISFDPVIEFLDNNCDTLEHLDIRTYPSILNETVISKIGSKFHSLKTIYIDYDENGIDISPIATIPTLKRVDLFSDLLNCEVINTFCDNLARTNSVEYLRVSLERSKIVGPSIKMNSLKCLILDQCDDWTDFNFENLPELEELPVSPTEPNTIDNTIKYILPNLPKLKILHLLWRAADELKKKQCMVLEQFLAEQNRKLFCRVTDSVFSKLMENPGDFKFLKFQKMDYNTVNHYFHLNHRFCCEF